MCQTCGCGDPAIVPVDLHESLLAGNARRAAHNREHLATHGVLAVNLMGSPGAGKTAILEATARVARDLALGAITGDLATENDAERLRAVGVPSVAITTGTACHLDATLVHEALHDPAIHAVDVLFVENVGNLVCPAPFGCGESRRVVLISTAEGDDKAEKHPAAMAAADLLVISKLDLLPHVDFDLERCVESARRIHPNLPTLALSARSGEGFEAWLSWLEAAGA